MTRRALLAAVLLLAACSHKKKPAYAADGTCAHPEGCSPAIEYPNEYMLPDDGRPAPGADPWRAASTETEQASCLDVGHTLASLELGNWADEEALGPAISKYRAACTRARLDDEERQCIFESTDRSAVAWCAPRIIPGAETVLVATEECASITTMMRAQLKAYFASHPLLERQVIAVEESCAKDRWTVAFGNCVRNVAYPAYVNTSCGPAAPAPLRKKLDTRLATVK